MNGYNFGQGCGNYYGMPTIVRNEYAFVDGIEAARAFQVRPGAMMLLMDSNLPICYKKQVDMTGRTVAFEAYDLVPHVEKPPVEYVTKEEFMNFVNSFKKVE